MNTTHPLMIWTMYNTETRRHEEIDLEDAELMPGETVVQLFWCQRAGRYVTVPGASLYRVQADGTLAMDQGRSEP
jgi:hypothetical protein